MNYKISVIKYFSAAHNLRGFKGKCEKLHGHNWKVKVTLSGARLNKTGMLLDFTDLKAVVDSVLSRLDHVYLNEVTPFDKTNPTAENIAGYIFGAVKKKIKTSAVVEKVEVWESESSSAAVSE